MLPITATPSAPPVWRVVSLTAEPTPALPGGNEPMIDSVAGADVKPMPRPNSTRTSPPRTTDDMIVSDAYIASAAATSEQATDDDPLGAERARPARGACGAPTMIPTATGAVMRPGLERRVAEHELEVLGEQERRAEQREVGQRDRRRRRREPRVAKEAHVEHGVGRVRSPSTGTARGTPTPAAMADDDTTRAPAHVGALDDAVEEAAERDDREHRTDRVEPPLLGVARVGDEEVAEHDGRRCRSAR